MQPSQTERSTKRMTNRQLSRQESRRTGGGPGGSGLPFRQLGSFSDQQARLLQLTSLFLPLLLWGISWVVDMVSPGTTSWVSSFQLLLAVGVLRGFVTRKETLALAFTQIFWLSIFFESLRGLLLAYGTTAYRVYQLLLLVVVIYALFVAMEWANWPAKSWPKKLQPVVRLVALFALLAATVWGVVLFFLNIKTSYLNLSVLFLLPGSFLLMVLYSGELDSENWLQPVKTYGPLLFALLYIFTLLIQAVLSLLLDKTGSSALWLFLNPLCQGLLNLSFVLPVYFLIHKHLRFPSSPSSAVKSPATRGGRQQVGGEAESEGLSPATRSAQREGLPGRQAEVAMAGMAGDYSQGASQPRDAGNSMESLQRATAKALQDEIARSQQPVQEGVYDYGYAQEPVSTYSPTGTQYPLEDPAFDTAGYEEDPYANPLEDSLRPHEVWQPELTQSLPPLPTQASASVAGDPQSYAPSQLAYPVEEAPYPAEEESPQPPIRRV